MAQRGVSDPVCQHPREFRLILRFDKRTERDEYKSTREDRRLPNLSSRHHFKLKLERSIRHLRCKLSADTQDIRRHPGITHRSNTLPKLGSHLLAQGQLLFDAVKIDTLLCKERSRESPNNQKTN